jgi:Arc/MetJ-type ribon-helix-helix transcriptional regulator
MSTATLATTLPAATRRTSKKATRKVAKRKETESLIVRLSPDTLDIIDELVEKTGSHTRSEFIRNMIRFVASTAAEIDEGNRPAWVDRDGKLYRSQIHEFLFQKPIC